MSDIRECIHCASAKAHNGQSRRHSLSVGEPFDECAHGRNVAQSESEWLALQDRVDNAMVASVKIASFVEIVDIRV